MLEEALEQAEDHERAGVADVDAAVDGRAADVDPDATGRPRRRAAAAPAWACPSDESRASLAGLSAAAGWRWRAPRRPRRGRRSRSPRRCVALTLTRAATARASARGARGSPRVRAQLGALHHDRAVDVHELEPGRDQPLARPSAAARSSRRPASARRCRGSARRCRPARRRRAARRSPRGRARRRRSARRGPARAGSRRRRGSAGDPRPGGASRSRCRTSALTSRSPIGSRRRARRSNTHSSLDAEALEQLERLLVARADVRRARARRWRAPPARRPPGTSAGTPAPGRSRRRACAARRSTPRPRCPTRRSPSSASS